MDNRPALIRDVKTCVIVSLALLAACGGGSVGGTALVASVLLKINLPSAAQAKRQAQQPIPNPGLMLVGGSITVSIRNEQGTPLVVPSGVSITVTAPGGPVMQNLIQETGDNWEIRDLAPGVRYTVQVGAPGYETAEQDVDLPYVNNASARLEFYLVPAGERSRSAPPGGAILAPRAQKEVQQGIKDLSANKISSAQKHLAKALKMAPGNPLVNYLVGESWLWAGKTDEAIRCLENALSLDPKLTQALLALGTLRYQQGDLAKAIELLQRAVEAAPKLWQAHWLLGAAYFREGNDEQARKHAEDAVKYGKEQADPARLIVGEALARLGKRDEALETFSDYLRRHPNDSRAEQIRRLIAQLRQPRRAAPAAAVAQQVEEQPQAGVRAFAANTGAPAAHSPVSTAAADPAAEPAVAAPMLTPRPFANISAKESWEPADVDEEKPERISDATCQLPRILRQAAKHAEELVHDLQMFTATEDFQDVEINRNGRLGRPMAQTFSYLVFIHHLRPRLISIEEMRRPAPANRSTGDPLTSTGSVALALVFHPDLASDFTWECEGMGEWKDQPAWLIRFRQRADRPTSRLHAFETRADSYTLPVKGLAWVAANGNHVLHLETDLVKPMEQVRLEREHFAIDYALVTFRTHPVALWLPVSVDTYFRFRGRSYHQYSRFSNFKLFWVGTEQKIGEPRQKPPQP
jgi:tetratricopeptide (TPR) repeat protein